MKSMRLSVGLLALGVITMAPSPTEAAWNNVFQVTCWNCGPRSSSSFYLAPSPVQSFSAPAAGCCDPCQTCTTQYVQRCFYQPVTCYQTQTFYEPVTSYVTKTYFEPVCSYRMSCYFDPCTCSYQQVATPVTSYVARQQCCPVQSWVQRCARVPVTSYQRSFYWEPVTTCSAPANPCPTCPPAAAAVPSMPPAVDGRQTPPPPTVDGKSGSPYDQYYTPKTDVQNRQYTPPNGQFVTPAKPASPLPPTVKMDRIALGDGTMIKGQVMSEAQLPKAGVRLVFVSAQRQSSDQNVTANVNGQFAVELAPGGWLVYTRAADGQQVFHSRVEVEPRQSAPIILVSR